VMGTPAYMAPEQARGQAELVGEATDVHALGAVLYEMLTGRPPYGNDRAADVLARLLREEPQQPRAADRRIPRDLETICLTTLAKDPSRRYPSMAALLEDIRRFESGIPPRARRLWTSQRVFRLMRRRWRPLAALAAAAAVAVVVWSLLVPRLTGDEAIHQLLLAAGWQHHEGRHDAAADLYAAALDQIDRRDGRIVAAIRAEDEPARRLELLRDIQRCVGEIDDQEVAAAIALSVITKNPWISFRHRDLAIAQVAFRQAASLGPRPWENETGRRSDPRGKEAWFLLRLAQNRLDLVLAGRDGSPAESRAAGRLRARIAEAFATGELPAAEEADRETADSARL
jgi:Protein kinase domain